MNLIVIPEFILSQLAFQVIHHCIITRLIKGEVKGMFVHRRSVHIITAIAIDIPVLQYWQRAMIL